MNSPKPNALNRLRRRAVLLFVAIAALASMPAHAQTAPDKLIETLSGDVLARIKADSSIREGSFARISSFVDETIMPNVNFQRMTALAVGRGWRDASSQQQAELIEQFRVLLLRTYAGALAEVKDQTVRMKPLRADPSDTDVIVRSEIVGRGTEPIQLDYRLEKNGTGWKIYDVNVLGVWLVETYRNQFRQLLSQGGVAGLVDELKKKNQQAAGN